MDETKWAFDFLFFKSSFPEPSKGGGDCLFLLGTWPIRCATAACTCYYRPRIYPL